MDKIECIYQEMKAEFEYVICSDNDAELSDLEHAKMLHVRKEILSFTLLSGLYDMHAACLKDLVDFRSCCECLTMMTKMNYDTDYEITEVMYVLDKLRSGDIYEEIQTYSEIGAPKKSRMNFWNIVAQSEEAFSKGPYSKLAYKMLYDYLNFLEEAWWTIILKVVKTDKNTELPVDEMKKFMAQREADIMKAIKA